MNRKLRSKLHRCDRVLRARILPFYKNNTFGVQCSGFRGIHACFPDFFLFRWVFSGIHPDCPVPFRRSSKVAHAQHSILQTSQQYPHLMPHSSFVIVRFFGTLLNIVSSRSSHRLISQIWHGLPDFVGGAAKPSQRDAARASLPARKRPAKDPPCPSLAENTHLNSKKSGNEAWIPRKPEHCTTKVLFL